MVENAVGVGSHPHYAAGNSDDRGMIGHRANDDRPGANFHIVADPDAPEDLGACSDDDVVADGGVALALLVARSAEGYALINENVVADLGGFAYHHAHAVIDEETPPDLRARMNFDAGEKAG